MIVDKELALENIIADQALEGLTLTEEEIARSRAILAGELTAEEAIAQIHRRLRERQRAGLPVIVK